MTTYPGFPQTKLQSPQIGDDLQTRPSLLTRLDHAITTHPLTLIAAPAGSGKTTLAAAWASASHNPQSAIRTVCWLTLDETDSDPARFIILLLAALRQHFPDFGANTETVLGTMADPAKDLHRVLGVLINELLALAVEPLIFFLDDLHAIHAPLVFQGLDYLLEHLPPHVHLVIATRHDPPLSLARLRARGQLAEFRLADLRFTPQEAAALLNDRLHLNLPSSEVDTLQSRTEGWVTGLRLLALSLERIPAGTARSDFIAQMVASDRYLFDFLAEEVLNRQDADTRAFLLQTSILPELTPALCRAVTGRVDAAEVLETLFRRNLFLTAVPGPEPIYHYHDLFAAFLRQQLERQQPECLPDLHRRAAEAQPNPTQAIRHYLAAEMWEQAAQHIVQIGPSLLRAGSREQLKGWILNLPTPVQEAHPWLSCFVGTIAYQHGQYDIAQTRLEQALQGFQARGDQAGQAEALLQLSVLASGQHNPPRVIQLAEQALALPVTPLQQVMLHIGMAWACVYSGDWARAGREVEAAVQGAWAADDPRIYHSLAQNLQSYLAFAPGAFPLMTRHFHHVLTRLGEEVGLAQLNALSQLGNLKMLAGDPAAAETYLQKARRMNASIGGFTFVDLNLDLSILLLAFARGDYAGFEQHWQARLRRYEQVPGFLEWLASYLYLRGRMLWEKNRLDEAQAIYERMVALERPQDIPENHATRLLLAAMLDISAGRYPQAEQTLWQVIAMEARAPFILIWGNARLLLAELYRRWNRLEDALAALDSALAESARCGMPGLLLMAGELAVPLLELAARHGIHKEQVARLLEEMQKMTGSCVVALPSGESLTPRETEVLRLITQGASNRDIAAALVISERTVKSHITHILGKLGVASRTQAAARARELHIL